DYFVALIQDITERKRAEQDRATLIYEQAARLEAEVQGLRSAFLAQVSAELSSSLDYETTLARVAELAVPYIADWCAVDILEDDQVIRRVAIAHQEPPKVELAWELNRRYPEDLNVFGAVQKVLQTGQSAIATEITDADLIKIARDAEHLQMLRQLGFKSYISVPMLARGRILGAITFVTAESKRYYTRAELPLVEDLAQRAALAVDNARLYHQTQEARQIAEREAERNATLQAVTAALSEALTPAQVAEVVVDRGIKAVGACAGFIALAIDDTTLKVVRAVGYPPEMIDTGTLYPITASLPLSDAVRMGKPLLVESRDIWLKRYSHIPIKHDHYAWADIPLIVEGRTVGGMGFSFPHPQQFSEDDCAFMQALAQQCAQAIERARAYAAEREARAEAEAANRTKDEFLAVLSHELRTPLNSMLGWTQLLLTRKFDEVKMLRALETIDRNTRSLAALIEEVLDVSRIITGKLTISPRHCELISVVSTAIEAIRPTAETKSIEIKQSLDPSVGWIWGDAHRLQQVVWNLLSNAVKFTPKGGQVEVKLDCIRDNVTDRPCARIQVIDTGKGISPDFLPYVFERFRQENTTSTRAYGGLGLGLAIVRYLVELHDGTVQAFSPGDGLGSTFAVQLPLLEGNRGAGKCESHRAERQNSNLHPLRGLQVLVVDDDADARALLATILEQSGAQVKAAASVAEALDLLSHSKADVLVSDIAMPDVDGYALIRQVRELEVKHGDYTPAVALTAYAREADRASALQAGFQVHLPKPFDPEALVNVVAKLAESKVTRLKV
ncbi:MAG: GAF domain-containing protein, partial [Coleofasciculus sp. S288]|nr:GAF domain-containing protein [Coleofasciculus sp. S288]